MHSRLTCSCKALSSGGYKQGQAERGACLAQMPCMTGVLQDPQGNGGSSRLHPSQHRLSPSSLPPSLPTPCERDSGQSGTRKEAEGETMRS